MEYNYCGHEPVYELLEVESQKLPKPEQQSEENYRKYDDVEDAWKTGEQTFGWMISASCCKK